MSLFLIPTFAFVLLQIYAAVSDAASMKISNRICLGVLITFALATPLAWESWTVFGQHMLVGLGVFIAGFIMFAVGGLGGGDAKLMAATALWWSPVDLLSYLFYTTLMGGVLAIFLMIGRNRMPVRVSTSPLVAKMFATEKSMPYGIALAIGALVTLPSSSMVARAFGF